MTHLSTLQYHQGTIIPYKLWVSPLNKSKIWFIRIFFNKCVGRKGQTNKSQCSALSHYSYKKISQARNRTDQNNESKPCNGSNHKDVTKLQTTMYILHLCQSLNIAKMLMKYNCTHGVGHTKKTRPSMTFQWLIICLEYPSPKTKSVDNITPVLSTNYNSFPICNLQSTEWFRAKIRPCYAACYEPSEPLWDKLKRTTVLLQLWKLS